MHNRKVIGAEIYPSYIRIAKERLELAEKGKLRIRPMNRPVYDPDDPKQYIPPQYVNLGNEQHQPRLFEQEGFYSTGENNE